MQRGLTPTLTSFHRPSTPIRHCAPRSEPLLLIVANAVALVPALIERLVGSTEEASATPGEMIAGEVHARA